MATLALSAAGSAAGGALLPGGVSLFGGAVSGASLGMALGGAAGALIDESLLASSGRRRVSEGARLSDLKVSASGEGSPIPRVYGRARLPGQIIWATRFEEEAVTTSEPAPSGGGKGLRGLSGGAAARQPATRVEYRYYANVAYAVCEGEITRIGRIWADGKELDQREFTIRIHRGTQTQGPDSLIQAKEGAGNVPAYRGTAYVVFERMPLARFGNRLPQLNFEVFRAVDNFEERIRAVTIIPASGEFVYDTTEVLRDVGGGESVAENLHTSQGGTDWDVAIDQLQDALPNVARASLFVSWFGTDLRAAHCAFRPGAESAQKATLPKSWSAGGVSRAAAHQISLHEGKAAFGGTPADSSVVAAIQDLAARGIAVTFCPFVLMDIPQGNALPDPYTGAAGQPAYPWRGRITVDPAPGQPGSPDKTPAAAAQLAPLIGTAQPADFTIDGTDVTYSGPAEWSLRRMVLHYAHLCAAAGGVDSFLLGTELRGLTQVRDSAGSYPFVDALKQLAADVRSVLGPETKISYAADWSEYFGHQPADGSGDVYFHLDPLWASPDIDAVAIDVYWPLSDWRDGESHADRLAGITSPHDLGYLKGNIFGGEGYDWFYAGQAERDGQIRSPISDGAHGKPWVFRFKDIRSWWSNEHFNRPAGVESATPTAWVPESKPIWFTEVGCPAVDKGANQPNVFIDPKSAESAAPHYSRLTRDDLIQRRYIQAFNEYFDPAHEDFVASSNPLSAVYGGRMVDPDRIYAYTWDARPYPAFPRGLNIWSDGGQWEFGHWLTGRVAGGPLPAVVEQIFTDYGFSAYSVAGLSGHLDGYVIDRVMSAREALESLELAFFFDSFESGGLIRFAHRGRAGVSASLDADGLVEVRRETELYSLTRSQETELPASAKLVYADANSDYRLAVAEARRLAVRSERVATANMPLVMGQAQAQAIAESWLQDSWTARERASFVLPPSLLALEPGDVVTLQAGSRSLAFRLTRTADGTAKDVEALSVDPEVFEPLRTPVRATPIAQTGAFGQAVAAFLDLPLLSGDENPNVGYVAAHQRPWPGAVAFYRSPDETGFTLNTLVTGAATIGRTLTALASAPSGRFDRMSVLRVRLDNGALQSVSELALLGGANLAAIENADGEWEVLQFLNAQLVDAGTYDLSTLLRGQAGTEFAMRNPVAPGARFVLIDGSLAPVAMSRDEIGLAFNWKYGPASREISHPSYQSLTRAFSGQGLKPLSPVHVRAVRAGADLQITWVRRTRLGGDSWEAEEVPLGEDIEAYEVDILDAGSIRRTLASNAPAVLYGEAEQIADWGSVQSQYDVAVYQLSAVYGRGEAALATLGT